MLFSNIIKVDFYLYSQKSFFIWEYSVCMDMLLKPEEKKQKSFKNFYNQFLLCEPTGTPSPMRPHDRQLLLTILVKAVVCLVGQKTLLGFRPPVPHHCSV